MNRPKAPPSAVGRRRVTAGMFYTGSHQILGRGAGDKSFAQAEAVPSRCRPGTSIQTLRWVTRGAPSRSPGIFTRLIPVVSQLVHGVQFSLISVSNFVEFGDQ